MTILQRVIRKTNGSKPSLFGSRHIPSFASTSPSSVPVPVSAAGASVFVDAVHLDDLLVPSVVVAFDCLTVPPGVQGHGHVLPSTVRERISCY